MSPQALFKVIRSMPPKGCDAQRRVYIAGNLRKASQQMVRQFSNYRVLEHVDLGFM